MDQLFAPLADISDSFLRFNYVGGTGVVSHLGDILFAVTKLFGTDSHVYFLAAITSRYRKLMGLITERVISGSNSNNSNNTG
jgi:hypothetical protein